MGLRKMGLRKAGLRKAELRFNRTLSSVLCGIVTIFACQTITAQEDSGADWKVQAETQLVEWTGLDQKTITQLNQKLATPDNSPVRIWIGSADSNTMPPILGQSKMAKNKLQFIPDFPLLAGQNYKGMLLDQPIKFTVAGGKPTQPTRVLAIRPSLKTVPENVLKFYVHFSSPMRKGEIYQYIRLERMGTKDDPENEKRVELQQPFLEIEQELWSRDSRRLTLLVDPGRIKQGLASLEEAGPIFETGRQYELTLSGQWPDAHGNPLNQGDDVTHLIQVGQRDVQCPHPSEWNVSVPKSKTTNALEIEFDQPLDSAVAQRMIRVFYIKSDAETKPESKAKESSSIPHPEIDLSAKIDVGQTKLKLEPGENWQPGNYEIRIDNRLEDLCGNSIGRPFDVDVFEKIERPDSDGETTLKFTIK